MDLQSHISEHLKKENEYIKSIYAEKTDGDADLQEGLQLRLVECSVGNLTAKKGNNVIHVYGGSVQKLDMSDGVIYFDGTNIQEIRAKNCRIRISDNIDGKKSTIFDLYLENCELEVWKSEFRGNEMLKDIKKSRVSVYDSDIKCSVGGHLDGGSFNMTKCDATIQTEGWTINNIDLHYSSTKIKMTGNIPLHSVSSCYLDIADTDINSKKVQFVGSKYSVAAYNSKFIGGCRAFEINDSGFATLDNCECQNLIAIKLKGSQSSCLFNKGKCEGVEYAFDLEDGATATILDVELVKGGQIGIYAKKNSRVFIDSVKDVNGGSASCQAEDFSSMDLKDSTYTGPIAFKGDEGTFIVRGDKTSINTGITASGSGTLVIDDSDDTRF